MKRDARQLSPKQQEALRQDAIRLVFEEGYNYRGAAQVLGVARRHLAKWCRLYEEGGREALQSKKRGRPPGTHMRLRPWQCALIVRTLTDKTPDQLKMPFVLWTRVAVRDWIAKRFDVVLPLRTLSDYLKRWGLSPQKPAHKTYGQNDTAVDQWLESAYPTIAQEARDEGAVIYWVDETGFPNRVDTVRGFAPRSQSPQLKEEGRKFRVNMISGVTNKGELKFMCHEQTMNQVRYLKFLKRLVESSETKVYVIAAHLRVHHGKMVKAWAKEHEAKIRVEHIPL